MIERFLSQTEFSSQEDFIRNFRINVPENFNFGYDIVDAWAAESPDKKALLWTNDKGECIQFTFGDLKKYTDMTASWFTSLGIGRGDKVMLILKRRYEFWFSIIALHKIGAVAIPATHLLTKKDIIYRCEAATIKMIVAAGEDVILKHITDAAPECPSLRTLVSVGPECPEGFLDFHNGIENAAPFSRPAEVNTDDDIMLMYFTSGTTGEPKMVAHDFTYPLGHIVTARYWHNLHKDSLHFTIADTGWAKAAWGKIYGQWLAGCAVMAFDFDNFDPKQLASIINQYKVTSFCAPPTVYRYLVRKGVPDMPSLKSAATAGEYLSPDIFHKFQERTGLVLHEGYGQTETSLLAANYKGMKAVDGSMGRPSPLYELRLLKSDGSQAAVGEIGEIVVVPRNGRKPLGIFSSYLDNAELYRHAWRGGVYHTGDAAWQDENGYLWFHSRFDDIIKTGGFRVGPYEIENILVHHPAVFECAVIGVQDPLRGQAIKALVVLESSHSPSKELEKEIKDYCNSRLAEYKWIRILEFVDELPKTYSGKVRKATLRQESGK